MAMKYMGIILKIVRNSFLEALSCQDEQALDEPNNKTEETYYNTQKIEQMYKKSMIAEVDEESEDEDHFHKNANRLTARKGAIRGPADLLSGDRDMTKREFGVQIQRSLRNIFEGCHKDDMKTTLSLRAILYENVTLILENITDFMDD